MEPRVPAGSLFFFSVYCCVLLPRCSPLSAVLTAVLIIALVREAITLNKFKATEKGRTQNIWIWSRDGEDWPSW